MARAISADALDVIGAGATYSTTLTVTAPGAEPVDVEHVPGWSVEEKSANSGTRLSVSSVTLLPKAMAVPSGLLTGAPVMAAVGATLATVTGKLALPAPPSLSVTVTVTV